MKKIIGNIKLIYNQQLEDDIERIVRIIELNPFLFADYQNKTLDLTNSNDSEENGIGITNFDAFFDNLLISVLQKKESQENLAIPELLPALYIQLLLKRQQENGQSLICLETTISDDILWFLLASKYYDLNTQFSQFSHFIKYHNNQQEIITWLKETQRFPVYNYLLEIACSHLKEYDSSFFLYMDEIIKKQLKNSLDFIIAEKDNGMNLNHMNGEERDRAFIGFLEVIKAPQEWKDIYQAMKKNHLIIYVDKKDGREESQVFIDEDGIRKIKVSNDNTIATFISLVHEFMHYITLKNNANIPFSLLEFPSIYYEKVAATYLVSIGYNEDIIRDTINQRNADNFNIYGALLGIMTDIARYNKAGPITLEEKVDFYQKMNETLINTITGLHQLLKEKGTDEETLAALKPQIPNYEKDVKEMCDASILEFVQKGLLILNGYQYLTDSQLADAALEKTDESIGTSMIYITEHLGEFTIEKVIGTLGLESFFEKDGDTKGQLQKQRKPITN